MEWTTTRLEFEVVCYWATGETSGGGLGFVWWVGVSVAVCCWAVGEPVGGGLALVW